MKRPGIGSLGIAIVLWTLWGCGGPSLNVRVTAAPMPPEREFPDKLPYALGLYLTDEFRNYRVTDSSKTLGTTYDFWNLGMESAGMLEAGLARVFQKLVLLEEKPPFSGTPAVPVAAVVEPAFEGFEFSVPALVFQTWSTKVSYRVRVYDPQGRVVWEHSATGVGNTPGSYTRTLEELGSNPSRSASQAIANGTDRVIEAILGSGELKSLLK